MSLRAPRPSSGVAPTFLGMLLALAIALWAAAPARAATTVSVVQAENGTLAGWYMSTVSDASAAGGSAVRYNWNGSVRFTVKLPADADAVVLRVRGDQCAGAPAYSLTIDNASVANDTVASSSWTDRSYSVPLVAGTHTIEVAYTNDYAQYTPPACDRNLYLDDVTFSSSGPLPHNPPIPAGFVHQAGTQLLDGAGRPLRLRGVDLGGWLLWEGWIWGQGFDYIGESAMVHNLASLVGTAQAEQFRSDVRANFITESDFQAMSDYGFNVARVPFNYRLLEDDSQPFVYKQSGWDVLDRVVNEAKQAGVYLVLDMHAAPCSQMQAFVSDWVGPDFLWSSAQCQDRMVAMWKAIAARYSGQNVIAGYDVLGETVASDAQLLDLYKRVTAAIRQVDPNHLMIYEGNYMARNFGMFTAPLDSNEALSFHDYPWAFPGQDLAARMPQYDAGATRIGAPQWVGEFGQSSYDDIKEYVDTFNADPLIAGWADWTWKQSPGFAALQTIQHTPASQKLIYWMNDPSRPQPTAAEAAQGMSDFIDAIRFENTVHDAKLQHLLATPAWTPPAAAAPAPAPAAPTAPAISTSSSATKTAHKHVRCPARRSRHKSSHARGSRAKRSVCRRPSATRRAPKKHGRKRQRTHHARARH